MELSSRYYRNMRWLFCIGLLLSACVELLFFVWIFSPTASWETNPNGGKSMAIWVIFGLLFLLPIVIQTLGQIYFQRFRFVDDRRARRLLNNKSLQRWCAELEALGFSKLGVMAEETFYGSWTYSIALSAPQEKTFASATRIGVRLCYFFYTPLTGGGILLTTNGGFREVTTADCCVQTFPKRTPAMLWELHQQKLEDFTHAGLTPTADYTPAARLKASQAFYAHPAIHRLVKRAFLKKSLPIVAVFFFLPAIVLGIDLTTSAGRFPPPAQQPIWQTYYAPDGSFSIALPNPPAVSVDGATHRFQTQDPNFIFEVTYTDYPPGIRDQAESTLLDQAVNASLPAGGVMIFAKEITLSNRPGRAFKFRDSDDLSSAAVVEGRLFLTGPRLYKVTITHSGPGAPAPGIDVFLDSFQLLDTPNTPQSMR
jgi:hypothetical protein